jgi:hypothetical protein
MTLPTREEINVFDSLDERSACEHFLGKSLDEACEMFRAGFSGYQEDLMWMGPVAFRYYVEAAVRYVESDAAKGDFAVPVFFGSVIRFRLDHDPRELMPVARRLAAACQYVLNHLRGFDPEAGPEEVRRQREVYEALRDSLLRLP